MPGSGGSPGPSGSGGAGNRSNVDVMLGFGGEGGAPLLQGKLDPLCGSGSCVPDDGAGCALEATGGVPNLPVGSGFGGAGGLGGAGSGPNGMAGLSANPGDLDSITASCLVSPGGKRRCEVAGAASEGEPCLAVTDCSAGLTCVGEGETGICRQYCCRGTTQSCDASSYCAPRTVLGEQKFEVPVCVPVDNCSLTETYPCPTGQDCACTGELACLVVRADGKTACARPGKLAPGESCDPDVAGQCAQGSVCSAELGCLTICSTQSQENGCGAKQLCQTPPAFPPELGVCVGGTGPEVAP